MVAQGSGLHGRPRMIDVGRSANVSAQTVSRYFTGGYVSAETKERIERAVEELGYRLHPAARQLRSNRTNAIGVIAMGAPNFGMWSLLEGMTSGVRRAGFTLIIGQLDIVPNRQDSAAELRAALDRLLQSGVDGVVIATPYAGGEDILDDLDTEVPAIVVSESPHSAQNSVRLDSYQGGVLAMDHLVSLGHRRVLHLSGDPATIESTQRKASYYDSVAHHNLLELVDMGRDWTADSGFEIGSSVDHQAFTAVFAANDAIASGFMSAMRTRGFEAPRDFSIVGIDNMPETRFYAPPLTTVTMDFVRLGRIAVEMMLKRIREGGSTEQQIIAPRLVVRESSRHLVV